MPSTQNKRKSENRIEKHFAFLIKKSGQVLDRIHPLNTTWVHALQGDFSKIFSLIMSSGKALLIQWRVRELLDQCTLCNDPSWLRALPGLDQCWAGTEDPLGCTQSGFFHSEAAITPNVLQIWLHNSSESLILIFNSSYLTTCSSTFPFQEHPRKTQPEPGGFVLLCKLFFGCVLTACISPCHAMLFHFSPDTTWFQLTSHCWAVGNHCCKNNSWRPVTN